MQLRRPATTLFLLGFTLQSLALTIGRPQGAAWIGKPLDIVIPLTLDENETGGDLCLEADVVQGDTRIDDRRVTLSLEPGSGPNAPRVHIRSTVAIDEPVVTVNVRAGCDMKSSRRYTLLADVMPEAALPSVARAPSPPSAATPRTSGAGVPGSRVAGSGRSTSDEGLSNNRDPATYAPYAPAERRTAPVRRSPPPVAAAPLPRAPDPAVAEEAPRRPPPAPPRRAVAAQAAQVPAAPPPAVRAPAPRPAPTPPRREATAAGTPRLQLDALEPTPGREGGLRTTTELTLPGTENPALRAEAAALWRAIAATPEEAQREAQRQQSMDATLAALREQTAQNQKALAEMRGELAEARDNRYRNPLTYALGGLLLLALLGLFMLWRMLNRSKDAAWWSEGAQAARVAERQGRESRAVSRFQEPAEDDEPDADLAPPPVKAAPAVPPPMAPRMQMPMPQPVPVLPAAFVSTRLVNTEELLDVQQQSDFFLSLGQHDQAIAVLGDHIAANPQTSALAYLDLLKIFHGLGRREDYDGVRQEFVNAFNADVPEFDGFAEAGGNGLESYRNTLARIESQWPAPSTLSLIEELVFRKPGGQDEVFDLAAYRELLLLYAVAKEVIDPDSTPPVPVTPLSFADTYGGEPQATVPATFGEDTEPDMLRPDAVPPGARAAATRPEAPRAAPSLYGAIEQHLQADTVMAADTPLRPVAPPNDRHSPLPGMDGDYSEFDRTAYETLRAPIEPTAAPALPSASDPVDFDLFDADTEAEIAPRRPVPPKKT